MSDIKLTLSTDTKLRAPSIEEEAQWMKEEGPLYYPLQGKPKEAIPGCWVYFIRDGQLVARSRADEFVESTELGYAELYTYTGQRNPKSRWSVKCSSIELASSCILHPGFQGFRYVTPEEQSQFEKAFEPVSQ